MNCTTEGCTNPARCALKTQRPSRERMSTFIYYDERTAPKSALPYCKPCALEAVPALMQILVDNG